MKTIRKERLAGLSPETLTIEGDRLVFGVRWLELRGTLVRSGVADDVASIDCGQARGTALDEVLAALRAVAQATDDDPQAACEAMAQLLDRVESLVTTRGHPSDQLAPAREWFLRQPWRCCALKARPVVGERLVDAVEYWAAQPWAGSEPELRAGSRLVAHHLRAADVHLDVRVVGALHELRLWSPIAMLARRIDAHQRRIDEAARRPVAAWHGRRLVVVDHDVLRRPI